LSKTKTTSFRRCAIAEAGVPRDFLLKTGLKSEFGSVEPDLSVAKSNWAYAVSSDTLDDHSITKVYVLPFHKT
jgi:hypothetical protein